MKRLLLSIMLSALLLAGMILPAAAEEAVTESEVETIMAVKAAWGLRLRAAPGLSSRVRFVLDCGEQVIALGDLDEGVVKNGLTWVQVSVTRDDVTTTGYVALKYLTEDLTPSCYLVVQGPSHKPGGGHPGRPPGGPPGRD